MDGYAEFDDDLVLVNVTIRVRRGIRDGLMESRGVGRRWCYLVRSSSSALLDPP